MNIDLSGKTALVCGGTEGIGLATARLMAEAGISVVLLARNEARLKETAKQLWTKNELQTHDYIISDMADPYGAAHDVAEYLNKGNRIDILVNNSGGPEPSPLLADKPDKLLAAFNQHIISAQLITQLVTPHMKITRWGRIVNIISTSAKAPIPGLGTSNVIRGAMASWAKTLAGELAPFGITVNNVLPGSTDTRRITALLEMDAARTGKSVSQIKAERESAIPMKRMARPEEIAAGALFLASDQASYITGINLPIDGGSTPCL